MWVLLMAVKMVWVLLMVVEGLKLELQKVWVLEMGEEFKLE